MMQSNILLSGLIGLIVGSLLMFTIFSFKDHSKSLPTPSPTMVMQQGTSMNEMVNNLNGKSGDDFDKAFIVGMIEHHDGAIKMANQARISAKHDEIKRMADNIIKAQTDEITQMKSWQQEWNY